MSRFWLVELDEDLEHSQFPTTRYGVWCGVHSVNGVKSLTDMSAVSFETLDEIMAPSDPELIRVWRQQRRARHAENQAAGA
jgi:hypothetical protein